MSNQHGKFPKYKVHISIDQKIYNIAYKTGNVSKFMNEAAIYYIEKKMKKKV